MKKLLLALSAIIALNAHAEILQGAYDDEDENSGTQFKIEWTGVNAEYAYAFKEHVHSARLGGNAAFRMMESAPLFTVVGANLSGTFWDGKTFDLGLNVPASLMYSFEIPNIKLGIEPLAGVDLGINVYSHRDFGIYDYYYPHYKRKHSWIFKDSFSSWFDIGVHAGLSFVYDKKYVLGARYQKNLVGLGGGECFKKPQLVVSLGYRFK